MKQKKPAKQAPFRELFGYLVRTYYAELGLRLATGATSASAYAVQIAAALQAHAAANAPPSQSIGRTKRPKGSLDWRTIKPQLEAPRGYAKRKSKAQRGDAKPKSKAQRGNAEPKSNTREALTRFLIHGLRGKVPGCNEDWLSQPSLAALKEAIEAGAAREALVTLKVPTRPDLTSALSDLCGHYIAYRFSLEEVFAVRVAREVITLSPRGSEIEFAMSFKLASNAPNSPYQTFVGHAIPLGKSLMCIGVHANMDEPNRDSDRGRSLFIKRDPSTDTDKARFGIMTTTRADNMFEPCAACTLLFRVEQSIEDLDKFRQEVTIILPFDEFMSAEFASLEKPQQAFLKIFLDNRPKGYLPTEKGETPDSVLKIAYERYNKEMPQILTQLYAESVTAAPFKANWQETKTLVSNQETKTPARNGGHELAAPERRPAGVRTGSQYKTAD